MGTVTYLAPRPRWREKCRREVLRQAVAVLWDGLSLSAKRALFRWLIDHRLTDREHQYLRDIGMEELFVKKTFELLPPSFQECLIRETCIVDLARGSHRLMSEEWSLY